MNLFAVAPNYDHNRRTTSFTCCINDGANERFAAKWEQLLWLPETRRSARSQDNRACHPNQKHAELKDPWCQLRARAASLLLRIPHSGNRSFCRQTKSTFVRPVADNSSRLHARKSRARVSLPDGLIGIGFFATHPKCRNYPSPCSRILRALARFRNRNGSANSV